MAGFQPPIYTPQVDVKTKIGEKVDYSNLPCPLIYEELHREAYMSLKPELFEGFRFDYNKIVNQKFFVSHNVSMGPTEVPTQHSEVIKIPTASYDFGATFVDPKLLLLGRVTTDGRLNARGKCDLTDNFSIKGTAQLTNEEHMSQGQLTFDYKGSDYRTQLQVGNGSIYGANYIQHVTPHLSLGGEVFWIGQNRKSGVGYTGRYETDKMIASGQVSSNGLAVMNYVQKVTEKLSLATDFIYNYISKDVTASVGYDCMFRQSRLRGKIDSNGVVAAYLEEQLSPGLRLLLSAEVDHVKKDYKFGFGVNAA
ncbi:PREDICTED: probable mitochondrial import receptor subunit TOM40-2 [Camelina sativa]|uniref:Probable mitochondrial import receptor subunit TOM40-2 n=1 Tax=Camelina sativa TaxID=90675 RepID=A0ABM0YGN2_CAMSA|nr:PREDICTED: probable mitochondrial import receptor subunit TOM40-2 [Camelina sativa]